VSRTLGSELAARGKLGALRFGRRVVVPLAAIEALLAAVRTGER
jgi:hypothetical protein